MSAPSWNIRDLVILLNFCNESAVALRSDGSVLAGLVLDISVREHVKLMIKHDHPIPFLPGVVPQHFWYPLMHLSHDLQQIWTFLGVPRLRLDHQFERQDEVFDIVERHRFFHISRMTQRLGILQMRPDDHPEEYQILKEFMAWWFRGDRVMGDSNFIDYEEVIAQSVFLFRTERNVFSKWEMQCAQRVIKSAKVQKFYAQWQIDRTQPGASTSGVSFIHILQQLEQDNEAP